MPTHPLSGLKAASSCMYDIVSLGEVMLRLDPGEARIHTARTLNVWEGGGEYNVARGLRRCFNQRAAIITALADNPIGRLVEDFMLQGGVDTRPVVWKPYDGVGRRTRNGLNFVERGFGPRAALSCSDRGHTAISQIQVKDVDWDGVFSAGGGTRWFHTGGIFAALSDGTPEVAFLVIHHMNPKHSAPRTSVVTNVSTLSVQNPPSPSGFCRNDRWCWMYAVGVSSVAAAMI